MKRKRKGGKRERTKRVTEQMREKNKEKRGRRLNRKRR